MNTTSHDARLGRTFTPFLAISLLLVSNVAHGLAMTTLGNEPLSVDDASYPGIASAVNVKCRVYYVWVNGNETFCFRGGTQELNAMLGRFAAIRCDVLQLIFLPTLGYGGGHVPVAYDWVLNLNARKNNRRLTLSVHAGTPTLDLAKLRIPRGVVVLGLAKLVDRHLQELQDPESRVDAASSLAGLPPTDEVLRAFQPLLGSLDDEDDYVRYYAARYFRRLGGKARAALPLLRRGLEDPNQLIREDFESAMEAIIEAPPELNVEDFHSAQARLRSFLKQYATRREIDAVRHGDSTEG
ncbi:MAG: HEAT repeat domain-containing protein [Planctomycetota bacterium]|nr:HEAT repeat domain-containing protein [Planctomycetota bacterium]